MYRPTGPAPSPCNSPRSAQERGARRRAVRNKGSALETARPGSERARGDQPCLTFSGVGVHVWLHPRRALLRGRTAGARGDLRTPPPPSSPVAHPLARCPPSAATALLCAVAADCGVMLSNCVSALVSPFRLTAPPRNCGASETFAQLVYNIIRLCTYSFSRTKRKLSTLLLRAYLRTAYETLASRRNGTISTMPTF